MSPRRTEHEGVLDEDGPSARPSASRLDGAQRDYPRFRIPVAVPMWHLELAMQACLPAVPVVATTINDASSDLIVNIHSASPTDMLSSAATVCYCSASAYVP